MIATFFTEDRDKFQIEGPSSGKITLHILRSNDPHALILELYPSEATTIGLGLISVAEGDK